MWRGRNEKSDWKVSSHLAHMCLQASGHTIYGDSGCVWHRKPGHLVVARRQSSSPAGWNVSIWEETVTQNSTPSPGSYLHSFCPIIFNDPWALEGMTIDIHLWLRKKLSHPNNGHLFLGASKWLWVEADNSSDLWVWTHIYHQEVLFC